MGDIYVYAPKENDLSTIGLVGALMPIECIYSPTARGDMVINMVHPLDEWGKWEALEVGCLMTAEVPVRTTPEIAAGQFVTTVEKWVVSDTATKAQRTPYTKATGGKKKKVLKPGTVLAVTQKGESRYKYTSGKSSAWIAHEAVNYQVTETIPPTPDGIERVAPSYEIREQIFRIYEVTKSRTEETVSVVAYPIWYDLKGNLTTFETEETITAQAALDGIIENCVVDASDFTVQTDMADTRTGFNMRGQNPLFALLDPDEGFATRWDCEPVYDDYELKFLKRAGMNRGVRIEYGKNMTGLEYTVSHTDVITRILPVGEKKDGTPLYLTDEEGDGRYVDSVRIGEYPAPHIYYLECSDAKVDKQVTVEIARKRMREQAEQMFADGCDMPTPNLIVDYVNLGDTLEYEQYKGLENLYPYDAVTIYDPDLKVDLTANVMRIEWDCVLDRGITIELGSLRDDIGRISGYQLGTFSGGKLAGGSVGSGALGNDVIVTRHLQADTIEAGHLKSDIIETRHLQAESVNTRALQAESVTAEKISAVALYAQHIIAQIAEIISANIKKADIGEAHIDWAKIVDLNAIFANIASAEIGKAKIDYAQIVDMVTQTAIITEGVGDRLFISRLAVTEANMVSLTTGELIVKGSDGQFYAITIDAETGEVRPVLKQVTNDNVADHTIDAATKVIENSITAELLNVSQIFANEALIGAITAANIAVGTITPAHVTSNFGATLDISSNKAILSLVSGDTVREMIADSTRELRVRYDGAGTHMTSGAETTTMTAQVFEGNVDVTGSVPEAAFVWTRQTNPPDPVYDEETGELITPEPIEGAITDAEWNAQHVGMRQIRVGRLDVNNRSIISCTLLAVDDLALTFEVDPDTLMLTITNPPYGADAATYDPATATLSIDGTGYTYDQLTQTITIDNNLAASRTTVQFTFDDETGVYSRMLMTKKSILLEVANDLQEMSASIQIEVDNISSQVSDKVSQSQLTQTASSLSSQISSVDGRVSSLSHTIAGLGTSVKDTINGRYFEAFIGQIADASGATRYGMAMKLDSALKGGIYASPYSAPGTLGGGLAMASPDGTSVIVNDGVIALYPTLYSGAITSDFYPGLIVNGGNAELMGGIPPSGIIACYDLFPSMNKLADLGKSSYRWNTIYGTSSVNTSDERYKKDMAPLRAVDLLRRLEAIRYRYNDMGDKAKLRFGFRAQQVIEAMRGTDYEGAELVHDDDPDCLGLVYVELIAPIVEGWQEHDRIIEEQRAEIDSLKAQLDYIKKYLGVDIP